MGIGGLGLRGRACLLVLAGLLALGSCRKAPEAPSPQAHPPTGIVYQSFCLEHHPVSTFEEQPERLTCVLRRLKETGLGSELVWLHPPPAPLERIMAVHTPAYVEHVRQVCQGLKEGNAYLDREDAMVSSRSFEVAVTAAGGPLGAIDAVMQGRVANAFCLIRPPGHHASREMAMGFCIFNNAAIAACYIQDRWKLDKVLIVDWDAHHGNGTQDIFYRDGSVFYFSTHADGIYPGTGKRKECGTGRGQGCILNVPLPKGSGDLEARKAYLEELRPAALAFKPDFILISAGFDSQEGEDKGKLKFTASGYAELTRIVKDLARTCSKGRIVSILEGGYNVKRLPLAVEAHLRALME